ncbi:MAG: shikimate dehydrogenase [Opitutales bacterium]
MRTGAMRVPDDEANRVRSWRALPEWAHPGTSLAVLGHPIAHSISPAMHNAALQKMAEADPRFADWAYFKFDVPPEELPEALPAFFNAGFRGLNLTIPHKVDALDLVAQVQADAAKMGAVNTLVRAEQLGGFTGDNSDGHGLEQALLQDLDVTLEGAKVVLLGAGGAARAAAVQCLLSGCVELWIGNRTPERLRGLAELLAGVSNTAVVRTFPLNQLPEALPRAGALIVNATSVGLKDGQDRPMDLSSFDASTRVYDMIYNPAETPLLRQARELGMRGANGLSMLVWQGARSLEIWCEADVPADVMQTAARGALGLA